MGNLVFAVGQKMPYGRYERIADGREADAALNFGSDHHARRRINT
jgi:hypothetical protein